MALFVTTVDQSRPAKSSAKVERPNNITTVAQGKMNPLDSKESLQGRVTMLTSRSEELKEYAMALTLFALFTGTIGLIVPLFLVVALGFLTGAAVCGIESKEASREAEEAKSQLNRLQAKETSPHEAEIEKLLNGEFAQFEEHGMFNPNEFSAMIERNKDGNFRAFSSYGEGLPAYPYEISGVAKKECESLPEAIVRYFVEQATSLDDIRFAQTALKLDGAKPQQSRARHICGFLNLLGDKNNPVNTDILVGVLDKNQEVTLDPISLKAGTLTISCPKLGIGKSPITFTVQDEEVGLFNSQHLLNPQADDKPIARFTTSRTVTVFPPDVEGNVAYTINRTFTKI